jgi:hypothetical protein
LLNEGKAQHGARFHRHEVPLWATPAITSEMRPITRLDDATIAAIR